MYIYILNYINICIYHTNISISKYPGATSTIDAAPRRPPRLILVAAGASGVEPFEPELWSLLHDARQQLRHFIDHVLGHTEPLSVCETFQLLVVEHNVGLLFDQSSQVGRSCV